MAHVSRQLGSAKPKVFIGSSTEGLLVARNLNAVLEQSGMCDPKGWEQGVFGASDYTMDSLVAEAERSDFAVLIATADDTVESRSGTRAAARDNVIFELGLFIGILGRERTYIVKMQKDDLRLPSDLNGLTYLSVADRADGNMRSAVNAASLGIEEKIAKLGLRPRLGPAPLGAPGVSGLEDALHLLRVSAIAQGWKLPGNSKTTFRLVSRSGKRFSLVVGNQVRALEQLGPFVATLRAHGLRVNQSVLLASASAANGKS